MIEVILDNFKNNFTRDIIDQNWSGIQFEICKAIGFSEKANFVFCPKFFCFSRRNAFGLKQKFVRAVPAPPAHVPP